jgi:hypothetical protein
MASVLIQTTGVAVKQRHSGASTTPFHYGHNLGNDHREAVEQYRTFIVSITEP